MYVFYECDEERQKYYFVLPDCPLEKPLNNVAIVLLFLSRIMKYQSPDVLGLKTL